jgi:hypothetical protein
VIVSLAVVNKGRAKGWRVFAELPQHSLSTGYIVTPPATAPRTATPMNTIILATINAQYIHASLGLRLLANLGGVRKKLIEFKGTATHRYCRIVALTQRSLVWRIHLECSADRSRRAIESSATEVVIVLRTRGSYHGEQRVVQLADCGDRSGRSGICAAVS